MNEEKKIVAVEYPDGLYEAMILRYAGYRECKLYENKFIKNNRISYTSDEENSVSNEKPQKGKITKPKRLLN